MKPKITIVGRGTVGCLAVIHFLRWTDWDIDWMYDPNIEAAAVGEGTNLILPKTLFADIDFDGVDMDAIGATPKMGIWKRGWGVGKEFFHTFPAGAVGIHFNAVQFQEYIFNKLSHNRRIEFIEDNVTNYEELDSDYVMVCTGSPRMIGESEYQNREHIPVNSCVVFQCPWEVPTFNYSLTFAKKHGWVFGIPLKNRCAVGYVFNGDISSEDQIKDDVQEILNEFNLSPQTVRSLKFNNYSRKRNFTNKVCYNGNASYFLEPLEATSTGFADMVNKLAYDMWLGRVSVDMANEIYNQQINETESMICLHYKSGSIYDSKFWDHAKKLGESKITEDFMNKNSVADIIKKSVYRSTVFDDYGREVGSWNIRSYNMNIDGLGITQELKDMISQYNV